MNDLFNDELFPYIKLYVENNSEYSPKIEKQSPPQLSVFPFVEIKQKDNTFEEETLSKGERVEKYIFEVNIYAKDQTFNSTKVSKVTVADELANLINYAFDTNYGMKRTAFQPIPNLDTSVYRIYIQYTCSVDWRKIIYRR